MQDLMKKADFPQDAAEEMLALIERLKKTGNWKKIQELSQKIMEELPREEGMREMLSKAESWEDELDVHKYTMDLLVLLCCWKILEGRYLERKYPMDIFRNSVRDLSFKMRECQEVYGVTGIFVAEWHDRFLDISRFALGRLQFELIEYPFEEMYTEKGHTVKKGDTVINVHIPSDGPLRKEDADAAFEMAEAFYRGTLPSGQIPGARIPDGPAVFVMDSWLLDTDMMRLLPEGNMKEFVNRFSVIQCEKHEKFGDGWRIFQNEWKKDPKDLPRRTKLQRAVADYLQEGGKLGGGYGIFVR